MTRRLDLWTIEAGKRLVVEPGPDGLLRLSIMTAAGDCVGATLTPGAVADLAIYTACHLRGPELPAATMPPCVTP